MEAKPAGPLGLARQWQNERTLPSFPSNAPVRAKKRLSAQRRNLSPLPGASGCGSQKQGPDGGVPASLTHRVSAGTKTISDAPPVATSLLSANKTEDDTGKRKVLSGNGVVSQSSSTDLKQRGASGKVVGATDRRLAKGECGMRELRIARHGPVKGVAYEKVAPVPGRAGTLTAETAAVSSKEQAEFERAIDTLNKMMEMDAKNIDSMAWVTRFTEGKAEARLSKEQLLPVWIIVQGDFVMAIDLNGTAQHCNYGSVSASHATSFPPCGCIVFPLQDALREGEVRLPENGSDVEKMMMPTTTEVRWGYPVGVLFINPHERISIMRNICQVFFPLFLRETYPHGVPLRGVWAPAASDTRTSKSRVMRIPRSVQDSVASFMRDLGISRGTTFTGDGSRLSGTQRTCEFQSLGAVPPNVAAATFTTSRGGSGLTPEPQESRGSPQSAGCGLVSPWGSRGNQPIFTARLLTSGAVSSSTACSTPCHAVLVLTPRGPLELVAEPPSTTVTAKDVKMSLLRSGLGRSLRLQRDTVRFVYAPSLPVIEDDARINARYVVIRLQTRQVV